MPAVDSIRSLILLGWLTATTAQSEDWTAYRGPAGDGKASEQLNDAKFQASFPNVLWKRPTPLGFSSFTVSGGRAFTLIGADDQEVCLAIDADTGDELWRVPLGDSDYGHDGGNAGARDNRGGDGPRATPVTDGTDVFVYDAHMVLRRLDAKTGNEVWKRDVINEFEGRNVKWLNATSPIVDGDRIYISGGGAGRSFLAFKKATGELIWKSGDETITHATPQLTVINDRKQIVFFVQSGLVGIDAKSGDELWRAEFPFSVSTAASPVVDAQRVYCSAGYGVGAGLFQVTDKPEADEVWFKANELMNHWSTPVVHDGHLYGLFEFKKYGRAPLQCVDLATGEIKWSHRGFGPGNCILVGDRLIVLSDAGEVAIVSANPDEYQELARADVLDGKCWSTPAYSDGRIYVRSTVEAACISLND